MTIKKFIKEATYNRDGQMIFGDNGHQLIASVRGWGAIQYLFNTEEEAGKFHDSLGQFIADAINEKLKTL